MKALGLAGFALVAIAASASAQQQKKSVRDEVLTEERAPKGMCRIWLKDVPAAQQPAATDCAAAIKNCPPNGRVIFGDTEESKSRRKADPKDPVDTRKSTPLVKPLTGKPPLLIRKPPE
jgi:hypothetical protein